MKIRYTNGTRITFEGEVSNPKEAFEWLSVVQELFEEASCGMCGESHLVYEVREYDGNNYYKLRCVHCGATLDFGQKRDGVNLFIKRRSAENQELPNRGWYKYQGNARQEPAKTQDRSQGRRETPF